MNIDNTKISRVEKLNHNIMRKASYSSYYGEIEDDNNLPLSKLETSYFISDEQVDTVIERLNKANSENERFVSIEGDAIFSVTNEQFFKILDGINAKNIADRLSIFNNHFSVYRDFSYADIEKIFTDIDESYVSETCLTSELTSFLNNIVRKTLIPATEISNIVFNLIVPLIFERVTFIDYNSLSLYDDDVSIERTKSDKKSCLSKILETANYILMKTNNTFELSEEFIIKNLDYLEPSMYIRLYGKVSENGKKEIHKFIVRSLEEHIANTFCLSPETLQIMNINLTLDLDAYALFSEIETYEHTMSIKPLRINSNFSNAKIAAMSSYLNTTAYGNQPKTGI